MSNRVVISETYGGFGLSEAAQSRLRELGWTGKYDREIERNDPLLLQVVDELGDAASGRFAELTIVELPEGVAWHVHEYDGYESVHEEHRSWREKGLQEYC